MRVHQTVEQKKIYTDLTNQNLFLNPEIIPKFNARQVELLDSDKPRVKNTQESFEDILDTKTLMQNLVSSVKYVRICNEISDTAIGYEEQFHNTSNAEVNSNITRNNYERVLVEKAENVDTDKIDDLVMINESGVLDQPQFNESPYIRWEHLDINVYPWAPLEIHLAKQMERGSYVPGVPMPRLTSMSLIQDNWSISISYRLCRRTLISSIVREKNTIEKK